MRWLEQLKRRFRILFRKGDVESELAEEVRLHVELEAGELVRQGWDPSTARREAHLRLGGIERTKEWVRDERGGRLLDDLVQDARYAQRSLRKTPEFTTVVILVLALGIGANTALFSAVNGLLLHTIPAADATRLIRLGWAGDNDMARNHRAYGYVAQVVAGEQTSVSFSYPMFEQFRASNATLTGMFAATPLDLNVLVDGQAEIASGFLVSGEYFDVLGVVPINGRALGPDDDRLAARPVAMISHAFWARRFGTDPDVVGRVITVNNTPVTIVGTLPPEYTGVQRPLDEAPDIHLPLSHHSLFQDRDGLAATLWWLQIMGRLKLGVTPEQVRGNFEGLFLAAARAGMDSYLDRLTPEQRSLSWNQNLAAVPRLWVDSASRGFYDPNPDVTRQALILGLVVVLVLLIVCANVANLLLSRASARQREIAVRLAMGATRGRLVRQLVTEGVLLSTMGGGLGLLLAFAVQPLMPFGQTAPFDWRVFTFVAVLSLSAAVVLSFVPALRATSVELSSSLKQGGRGVARRQSVLGKVFLVLQVAVSIVLVVGAGLFLKTLGNLRDVDVGFTPASILLFRVDPDLNGYDAQQQAALYDRLTASVRSVPGVRSVALSDIALLSGGRWTSRVFLPGSTADDGHPSHRLTVSPEFFEAMEIPLLAGRPFDARDTQDAPEAVVINGAAARLFFGTEPPLGRRFGFSAESTDAAEIVGVVGDVKYESVRAAAPPTVYRSHLQSPAGGRWFEVRTSGLPGALTAAVRDAVRRVDPHLPLTRVTTQAGEIERRFSQERLFALAYSMFGSLAMVLAAIGLFGVVSYGVAQRTNEIGIRMALGAEKSDVRWMVQRESMALVGIGVGIGLVGVFLTGRLVASLLFDLAPTDAATIAQAVALMLAVAALAGYLPARRAAAIDPLVALRHE